MRNGHASMARKRYLLQAFIGSFFCSLGTASASEPTLRETVDFLQRKSTHCRYNGPPARTLGYTILDEATGTWEYVTTQITLQDDNTIEVATSKGYDTGLDTKNYNFIAYDRWTEVKNSSLERSVPERHYSKEVLWRLSSC